jgi:hypothetical protein
MADLISLIVLPTFIGEEGAQFIYRLLMERRQEMGVGIECDQNIALTKVHFYNHFLPSYTA